MAYLVLEKIQPLLLTEDFAAFRPRYPLDILNSDWSCCRACYRCLQSTCHQSFGGRDTRFVRSVHQHMFETLFGKGCKAGLVFT